MNESYYLNQLYPLQDEVLETIASLETEFYLTGGTAISRFYCHHRFSDDLDFFVNYDLNFVDYSELVITTLSSSAELNLSIQQRGPSFYRLEVLRDEVALKIDLVKDVPAHVGDFLLDPKLGKIDSSENLIANKVTSVIDRREPKDYADMWALTKILGLNVEDSLAAAQGKAAGIFHSTLAEALLNASITDWEIIKWWSAPNAQEFVDHLHSIGTDLILGRSDEPR